MIDTHSHIYGAEFDEDRDLVVARAKEIGVEAILLPNINVASMQPMLELCRQYPGYCYPMLGLHPEDVKEDYAEVLSIMKQNLLGAHPYIGVGEIGLDFYWDDTYREQQLEAFECQLQWACEFHLPVVIHSRNAHRELVEVMTRHRAEGLTGVFHCFGGTEEEAQELLNFDGFALGIGGVLTYKKSILPEVLKTVPLERIVIETDAPYLAPVPCRGKRNESSFLVHTARCLAEVYGCAPERVDEVTTKTAKRIFRLS